MKSLNPGSLTWCFWTVVLKKTLESPLDSKKVKLVNPKGNQSWIFIGRTDAEAEALILRSPDTMSWLIGKDPDDGEDWEKEEKGTIEDEMVGWHHRFNGHEFEHTRRQWRTGKSGMLQSMGSQRVGHDWATEQQQAWLQNHHIKLFPYNSWIKARARWSPEEWDRKKIYTIALKYFPLLELSFFHLKYLIYGLQLKEKGIVAWLFPTRNHHLGSNFDLYKNYFKPSRLLQYWIVFWKWSLLESWECVQHQGCHWSITFHLLFWPLW